MIKKGDIIIRYTALIGGDKNYYIEEVYENTFNDWMVIMSWEDEDSDTGWKRVCNPLSDYEGVLQSGHIKIVGNDYHKPITHIREHSFNPRLRTNIPIVRDRKTPCPYRTPRLYDWE